VTNSLQELVQRETSGQVIDEHLDPNPGSLETWGSRQLVWVNPDYLA